MRYITNPGIRELYIRNAQYQLSAIETAWKDVTKGYAILRRAGSFGERIGMADPYSAFH